MPSTPLPTSLVKSGTGVSALVASRGSWPAITPSRVAASETVRPSVPT